MNVVSTEPLALPPGMEKISEIPAYVPIGLGEIRLKSVFWLHEPTNAFGFYGNSIGFTFPSDQLVYIEVEHHATFRGAAVSDRLRIYSLLPPGESTWLNLGFCTPTRERRDPEQNRNLVRAEFISLEQSSPFVDRFAKTVRFVQYNEPY